MKRASLLDKLDRATEKAVEVAIARCLPLGISKKTTIIGRYFIEKNTDGSYSVKSLDNKSESYEYISNFDVAVIICQRLNNKEFKITDKVLSLDRNYSRYRAEMINYINCLKGAAKRRDFQRMAILEDKFQMAEIMAKDLKDSISFFKRLK